LRNDSKAASGIVAINDTISALNESSPTASVNSETSSSIGINSSDNNNNATGLDQVAEANTDRTTSTIAIANDTQNGTTPRVAHLLSSHESSIQTELHRNTTSLIDLMLPYMENEILTNLINDELVSSVIVGNNVIK